MKTKNIATETMKRIEGLEKKKADELAEISKKIAENETALAEARKEVQNATESIDLETYQNAKKKEAETMAAIEMYTARYDQLERREYVTTKASDATIDSLLQYEEDIRKEYEEAIAEPIEQIKKVHADYLEAVRAAENTILAWTHRIHANYRAFGTVYANGSNVSTEPVPVHRIPVTGCKASSVVDSFLEKMK